jgi:hypothetical protein
MGTIGKSQGTGAGTRYFKTRLLRHKCQLPFIIFWSISFIKRVSAKGHQQEIAD